MTLREWFRKSQFPVMLALGTYSGPLLLALFFAPALLPYIWVFPAAFAVMAVFLLMLPGKLRVFLGICGALLLTVPCVLLLDGQNQNTTMAFAPAYAGLLLWCLFLPSWDFRREIPAGLLGVSFVIGIMGCFMAWVEPRLASYALGIRLSFVGFVFLAMLSLNRGSLNLALGISQMKPVTMRRKNLVLTIGLFAIAFLVATVPWLIDLVEKFILMILRLLLTLQNLEEPRETTEATTIVAETTEDWMAVVLEGVKVRRTSDEALIIIGVIAVTVAGVVLYFALRRLWEMLKNGWRHLGKWLETASSTQQDDYIDEITDTRDDATVAAREKRRDPILPPRNLTPNQKIRYRYRRLLSKHPEWKRHHTARDNLPEEAAKLYERARYSDHTITSEEAELFQIETK